MTVRLEESDAVFLKLASSAVPVRVFRMQVPLLTFKVLVQWAFGGVGMLPNYFSSSEHLW